MLPDMKYDEFIKDVQHRAGLEDRERAEEVTLAVLQALADRLTGDEADDLIAQLPQEFKERITISAAGQRWTVNEFVERVAAELAVEPDRAREVIQAVFETLRDAITPGEFHDVLVQLPSGYVELLVPEVARR
jgi:uncharacterized protein (DUF2267 family)